MPKAKIQRYVAGKRPKYAENASDDSEDDSNEKQSADINRRRARGDASDNSDDENERIAAAARASRQRAAVSFERTNADDPRIKRLADENAGASRRRQVAEPVILKEEEDDNDEDANENETEDVNASAAMQAAHIKQEAGADSDEEEQDAEARARHRLELRKRALQRQQELMAAAQADAFGGKADSDADDKSGGSGSDDDDDEYEDEEYSESDDEMVVPRLKPVFVRKTDRVTIQEKNAEAERQRLEALERERQHEVSKAETRKIIEKEVAKEHLAEKETDESNILCEFDTDDEAASGEAEYELWKLRELKRIKRDRDERDAHEREAQELQRVRNMTEEERLAYLAANPKQITNQAEKGKYKYMQKYYHRGAFFMDQEEDVLKRNVAVPTLEDHFDKTVLPKIMQVKNFGLAGRTKYTHLLDQDTTRADDNPWAAQEEFIVGKGGGTKPIEAKTKSKKRID